MRIGDAMPDSRASSCTIEDDTARSGCIEESKLDLSSLPPTFILNTNISTEELNNAEDELINHGAPLTYDIKEANLVLGNILRERRAKLELQWGGVRTDTTEYDRLASVSESTIKEEEEGHVTKRRKLSGDKEDLERKRDRASKSPSSTEAEDEDETGTKPMSQLSISQVPLSPTVGIPDSDPVKEVTMPPTNLRTFAGKVKVVKLEWLKDSLSAGMLQPFMPYTVYEANHLASSQSPASPQRPSNAIATHTSDTTVDKTPSHLKDEIGKEILERAKADSKPYVPRNQRRDRIKDTMKQEFAGRSFIGGTQSQSFTKYSKLLHQTTSEHDEGISATPPEMPDWVRQNKIYSCERSTPLHPPNEPFIDELKKIKLARVLTGDEIGVRAYSTSIASLAAYPHVLSYDNEILALPGCDHKIAALFHEWRTSDGHLRAVTDLDTDPVFSVLRLFYEIWGVGAITAREFYYDHGWRDLDDIIEHGWKSLSRVQQIGVKYYDEFQLKIPRAEVHSIAAIIHEHGARVTDTHLESIIVGGHRRGKLESGDVDLILSHRDEAQTYNLVTRVVKSLEQSGHITHTLTLNLTNTKRDQQPLALAPIGGGHGFDTLDKALVVWQSQEWPTREADLAADPKAKNPNPHRRVDIIISPWRTVGCAVQGWTSGTTFERDLRRYAKKVKGWKFDSSGVRERGTGRWVDLERWSDERTRARTWQEAERRVFEGFGLTWREPEERCTG